MSAPPPAFAEFAATSHFSFLRGAAAPEEYVARAAALGYAAVGIADRNTLAGVVRAHTAAKEAAKAQEASQEVSQEASQAAAQGARPRAQGARPGARGTQPAVPRFAVGCRLVFADGTPDVLAYPTDRAAYGRLCRMLSEGNMRGEKGACEIGLDDLLPRAAGLCLALVPPHPAHGAGLERTLARLAEAAPDHLWLALALHRRGDDARRLARVRDLGRRLRLPVMAVGDVLYDRPESRPLADVVTCIREHLVLEAAGRRLEANAERHMKPPAEIARLFAALPEALEETIRFRDRLAFSLDELRYEYPHETRAGYATPQDALAAFVAEGAKRRYPQGVPEKVSRSLDHELSIIAELGYAPFFLTVHDIVRHARSPEVDILAQGRGSAANSAVCYCLGVTEVDPQHSELLFERFISKDRGEAPDIDIDFEHERRGEILQYVYDRYGRDRAGLVATTITYRTKSAVREVGKVFGFSEDAAGALAGQAWGWSSTGVDADDIRRAGMDPEDHRLALAMSLARRLIGFPRHLSQHVGGMIITEGRLDELVPITRSGMEERPIVEWNKDDLDELGILKVDLLALGMLTALKKCLGLLKRHYGLDYPLPANLPAEEEAVYRMLTRADSIGVFQVESRAQQSMLPRLKPERFSDLVAEVAIVRPGPIQGGMVHPYLRRRQGREKVEYPSPELEAVLKETLGVPLFQEQVMRIAMVAAGFTAGEADQLRRAMATFRRVGTIGTFHTRLLAGMRAKGYKEEFIDALWKQIQGFGSYGFPKSHAESFALLVYASAWIKCRYPDVFAAGMLNSWPLGFYAPAQLVRDAAEHGVEIRPVDLLRSGWDHDLEPGEAAAGRLHPRHRAMAGDVRAARALRLGFRQIDGLREDDGRRIVERRGRGYDSVRDLWLRTGLSPAVLEKLALADAFGSLGLSRRDAFWAIRGLGRSGDKDDLPLFRAAAGRVVEPDVALPPMPPGEEVVEDYRHLKMSLKAHPVAFARAALDRRGVLPLERLAAVRSGRRATVAGLVLVRQRPDTASGVIFLTLEDEGAWGNVIVWARVFEANRAVVLGARFVAVTGPVQNEDGVVHLVAERFEDLAPLLDLGAAGIDPAMPPDEAARPPAPRRPPGTPRIAATQAMPGGRNFH